MSTNITVFRAVFTKGDTVKCYGVKVDEGLGCTETFCESLEGIVDIMIIIMSRTFKSKDSRLMISCEPPYSIEGSSPLSLRRYFTLSEEEKDELWKYILTLYHQE